MKRTVLRLRRMAPLAMCVAAGLTLAGCMQTPGNDFSKPAASLAKTEPMDLSATATATADQQPAKPGTKSNKLKPAPADPAIPTPGDSAETSADADGSAVATKPRKPVVEPDPSAAAAFAPAATEGGPPKEPVPVAKTVRDDGFPNINMPPDQPTGKLLSPEERAKVITELEALRNRQGVAPQTPQKKPAKKCTDEQIAAGEKGCPAPATN